jgi:hypothetical protein
MQNYRAYFGGVVDDIRAFLDGNGARDHLTLTGAGVG